jgi:hypothetical protein
VRGMDKEGGTKVGQANIEVGSQLVISTTLI